MKQAGGERVPLSQFIGDSALFGLGGMADRLIGFLFLPVTASILGSAGFGVYNLYSTSAAILFMLCAVGMHGAYFRFATEESTGDVEQVLDTALTVIHAATAVWMPVGLYFAAPLSELLVGVREPWFVYWLCLRTYSDTMGSLADCKLQVEGRLRLFLSLRVPITVAIRAVALGTLIYYRTPLALAAGEALGGVLTTLPMCAYVLRQGRFRIHPALLRPMFVYGAGSIPGFVSAWLLVAANRYLLKAYGPNHVRDVGLFSLAERFSSVMLLAGQTLWLGWRRYAFRNMHLADGGALLGRGMTLYFAAAGFIALSIALLGPAVTHTLISDEFAAAEPLIPPLTLAAFLGAMSGPLRIGLFKERRSMTMSLVTMAGAVVSIGAALMLIPTWAAAGAVAAALAGQAVGSVMGFTVSQRVFRLPYEWGRLAALAVWFAAAYGASLAIGQLGWAWMLAGSTAILAALPFLIYHYGPLSEQERQRIRDGAKPLLARFGRA
ncbi:MAG: oligosaccharide flippase family protein [Bryobacterales bacterium]|nr:oligosaccharide flippase family protein [Bryobacterales bacterium]